MRSYRTVLEQRIRERRQTLEEFAEYAEWFAREHGEPGTLGVRHLQRLVAGRGAKGKPLGPVRPATARLLERIFGESIDRLLAEPEAPDAEDTTGGTRAKADVQARRNHGDSRAASAYPATDDVWPRGGEAVSGLETALGWLDQRAGWMPETAKRKVRSRLTRLSAGELLDRNSCRARVRRSQVVDALTDYYGRSSSNCSLHGTICDDRDITTSILTRPEGADLACPLSRSRRVSPKPLKESRAEARIGTTLRRELKEEMFGRAEVDSTAGEPRIAAPMHRNRLSGPMRWLLDEPGRLRMECTGFGFNLVSGNYEFASLVVIEDEEFWRQYGGDVEANWEASGLRLYSTLDRELVNQLVADESWSNEGLFALLQGIRRLGELDDARIDLPTIGAPFTTTANGR